MRTIYRIFSIIFGFIVVPSAIFASADTTTAAEYPFPDSTYYITNIFYVGNETTKDHIIEREMSLKSGSLVTHDAVHFDTERIYSLQLFTRVDLVIIPEDSIHASLLVSVNERWYFYPFPILGIKDHNWSHIFYGAGLTHTNFGGRNVKVNMMFALGYDPFVSLSYTNPVIDPDYNLFFSTRIYYSIVNNRSLVAQGTDANFTETEWGGELTLGKRLSLFSTLRTTVEYTVLSVSDNRAGRTLSPSGTDRFVSLQLSYNRDTRDLAEYPRIGSLLNVSISKYGFGPNDVNYQRYSGDFRRYIPLYFNAVFAGRIFGNISGGGIVPSYGHVYYGYNERIRGHYHTIIEGENIVGSNAELRIPLLYPRYIRIEQIPVEQFRDIRYALYFAFFADAGNVWYRSEPLTLSRFVSGYGAGFHFLLAYSFLLRLEYAWGDVGFKNGQIIADIHAAL